MKYVILMIGVLAYQRFCLAMDDVYCNGQRIEFAGDKLYPNGKRVDFAGDALYPNGNRVDFAGDLLYPDGKRVDFAGDLLYPNGKRVKFAGDCFDQSGTKIEHCPDSIKFQDYSDGIKVKGVMNLIENKVELNGFKYVEGNVTTHFQLNSNRKIVNITAHCE